MLPASGRSNSWPIFRRKNWKTFKASVKRRSRKSAMRCRSTTRNRLLIRIRWSVSRNSTCSARMYLRRNQQTNRRKSPLRLRSPLRVVKKRANRTCPKSKIDDSVPSSDRGLSPRSKQEFRGQNQGMPKLRVYQLARELNRDNAEIIRELQHMGVPVTSHSNTVEDRLADRLRKELGVYVPAAAAKPAPPEEQVIEAATVEAPAPPETAQPEPVHVEPEPVHIEAKAQPKVEEKAPAPAAKVAPPPA